MSDKLEKNCENNIFNNVLSEYEKANYEPKKFQESLLSILDKSDIDANNILIIADSLSTVLLSFINKEKLKYESLSCDNCLEKYENVENFVQGPAITICDVCVKKLYKELKMVENKRTLFQGLSWVGNILIVGVLTFLFLYFTKR